MGQDLLKKAFNENNCQWFKTNPIPFNKWNISLDNAMEKVFIDAMPLKIPNDFIIELYSNKISEKEGRSFYIKTNVITVIDNIRDNSEVFFTSCKEPTEIVLKMIHIEKE